MTALDAIRPLVQLYGRDALVSALEAVCAQPPAWGGAPSTADALPLPAVTRRTDAERFAAYAAQLAGLGSMGLRAIVTPEIMCELLAEWGAREAGARADNSCRFEFPDGSARTIAGWSYGEWQI